MSKPVSSFFLVQPLLVFKPRIPLGHVRKERRRICQVDASLPNSVNRYTCLAKKKTGPDPIRTGVTHPRKVTFRAYPPHATATRAEAAERPQSTCLHVTLFRCMASVLTAGLRGLFVLEDVLMVRGWEKGVICKWGWVRGGGLIGREFSGRESEWEVEGKTRGQGKVRTRSRE